MIEVKVKQGMRLADLLEQDSYSYDIAHVHTGARNRQALLEKYNRILEALHFDFAPVEENQEVAPDVVGITEKSDLEN
ncbi:MAG: hypothetical protein U5S82_21300 [Gammaproteobacteria bacterium]|nr:hypothetical protein [Gammaproteobacteria bacterium]